MLVNLTPAVLDLKLYANDQTAVIVHVKDRVTKQPVDLSNRNWTSQWRRKRTSTTFVALSVDQTDAVNGNLTVYFPGNLDPCGTWDLQGDQAGILDTILTGDVFVEPDVTRP